MTHGHSQAQALGGAEHIHSSGATIPELFLSKSRDNSVSDLTSRKHLVYWGAHLECLLLPMLILAAMVLSPSSQDEARKSGVVRTSFRLSLLKFFPFITPKHMGTFDSSLMILGLAQVVASSPPTKVFQVHASPSPSSMLALRMHRQLPELQSWSMREVHGLWFFTQFYFRTCSEHQLIHNLQ